MINGRREGPDMEVRALFFEKKEERR